MEDGYEVRGNTNGNVGSVRGFVPDTACGNAWTQSCRRSGKNKFTQKELADLQAAEKLRAADRNPYSWNMELLEYPDGSGYEARFTSCGICTLMRELGIYELTPALCRLDYAMSEAGGASEFVRKYTLASGGPYCDCGYRKKN